MRESRWYFPLPPPPLISPRYWQLIIKWSIIRSIYSWRVPGGGWWAIPRNENRRMYVTVCHGIMIHVQQKWTQVNLCQYGEGIRAPVGQIGVMSIEGLGDVERSISLDCIVIGVPSLEPSEKFEYISKEYIPEIPLKDGYMWPSWRFGTIILSFTSLSSSISGHRLVISDLFIISFSISIKVWLLDLSHRHSSRCS